MRDIFDVIMPDEEKIEDMREGTEPEDAYISNVKNEMEQLSKKLNSYSTEKKKQTDKLKTELLNYFKGEIEKIKPQNITNVIERTIEKKIIEPVHIEPKVIQAPPAPPQIIKEVRVEVQVEKKDQTKYVEESKYLDLLAKVSKMEKELKETRRMAQSPMVIPSGPGGPGVIGIPPPEPHEGKVLTVVNRKATWQTSGGGGGGTSSDAYTVTNATTDRAFDADDTSLDEVADVLGSLISSLQGAGIIQ